MIEYKTGNLLKEEAEALVNTVNCEGFMGRGIALAFKRGFPANFRAYADRCERNKIKPGQVFVFDMGEAKQGRFFPEKEKVRYIVNFPTKRHWRGKSRLEYIESGLESLVDEIRKRNIRSIAIPALGCGLGGLDWPEVRQCMQKALAELAEVKVVIFEPEGGPENERGSRSPLS